jgi:hypothetical protein
MIAMSHFITKKIYSLFAVAFLTVLSLTTSAQSMTGDDIKAQFIKDWERAKAYTMDFSTPCPRTNILSDLLTASGAFPSRCFTWRKTILRP